MPLPAYGFDPTEAAIPWSILTGQGHEVVFATPHPGRPSADNRMLTGSGLGLWKELLMASEDAVAAYYEMQNTQSFNNAIRYEDADFSDFNAILLPGGHDQGMKEYLESTILQELIADFFAAGFPVAAICHGVVLVARSRNRLTGKSVLYDYKTTALLKSQESIAHYMTRLWLGDYYLTYPGLTVEDEVTSFLSSRQNFKHGPPPLFRDGPKHKSRGFVVTDRNYVSARWPGDAYRFPERFGELLKTRSQW